MRARASIVGAAPGAIAVVLLAAGAGCAPSLSTFQPAHVAPAKTLSASAGLEVGVPVGAVDSLFETGKAVAQRGQSQGMLSTDETWQVFDAAVNLLLNIPSAGPHFALGYVPVPRFEIGVRYAGTAWRGGARYQILDHATAPFDLTVGLGLSRFTFEFPISDQIPGLDLQDFSRWQVDVPILAGTSRDWFRVWVGPKLLFTTFDTQLSLTLPNQTTLARFEGTATFVGGQGGVALGYRHLFLAFELTLAEAFGTAHLTAPSLSPAPHDTSLSSFTIFPSVGLMGEI